MTIAYQLNDGIATLAIDDGKANVVSLKFVEEMNAALDKAESDRAALLLTGKPGTFCAGFDLKVFSAGGADVHKLLMGGFRLAARILAFPNPVVIAVSGHAIAMGAFLALSGDHRVGADGAFKIGANEVAIGLTMPRFGVEVCRHRLTPAYFHRSVITAELYTPAEAVTAGFLDRIVPDAQLAAEGLATATRLAKLPRATYRDTKARTREVMLKAIHAAIEADDQELAKGFLKAG